MVKSLHGLYECDLHKIKMLNWKSANLHKYYSLAILQETQL